MEELEALQFELESLLYTKDETELKEFAVSISLDVDLWGKSKIAATKLIQKSIEERVNEDGELSAKVLWFGKTIISLKPASQKKSDSELALSELQRQIEVLKQKQQAETDNVLSKLAHAGESTSKWQAINRRAYR